MKTRAEAVLSPGAVSLVCTTTRVSGLARQWAVRCPKHRPEGREVDREDIERNARRGDKPQRSHSHVTSAVFSTSARHGCRVRESRPPSSL